MALCLGMPLFGVRVIGISQLRDVESPSRPSLSSPRFSMGSLVHPQHNSDLNSIIIHV